MSDEQRKGDETEVEGHGIGNVNDDSAEEDENEVEAHVQRIPSVRME
jgi:hypothetical protein